MKFIGHVGLNEAAARDWARQARASRISFLGARVYKRCVRAGGVVATLWVVIATPVEGSKP